MTTGEIKIGGMYLARLTIQFREEREVYQAEVLVKVISMNKEKGYVEVTFPPFNVCHWLNANQIQPLG